jgi:hypothetical protein
MTTLTSLHNGESGPILQGSIADSVEPAGSRANDCSYLMGQMMVTGRRP